MDQENTSDVAAALAALTEEIKREHDRAAHREEIIDRLQEDNQRLRHSLLQEALLPIRAGLYRLHDQVSREVARLRADPQADGHHGALMAAIAAEVAEVLARTGVELMEVEAGQPYDRARHRAIDVADGPDGLVVAVAAAGFEQDGRTVRKADVVLGRAPLQEEDR
ncbi:nucleotide exchange factor GrpE [Nonomuraea sp. NPDC050547]|uniref:nucleotide exchange factor GrpE n=1 Tax=Nonomuraea sp. NPDC050547 TaxID=3364368 RepID=UPI003790B9D5